MTKKRIFEFFSKRKKEFFIFFAFLFLTLIFTYPVIIHFNTHQAGDGGDGLQNLWNFWWMKKAIFENFENPYFTNYLHHPNGTTLVLHTLSPLSSFFGAFLSFFISDVAAYNLIFFLTFSLTGFSMYLLTFYLTKSRITSFFAGCTFTFCPYHLAHGLGHLNLISLQWLPFFSLYLIKSLKESRKRNLVLTVLFFILTFLSDFYYAVFCLLIAFLIIIFFLFFNKKNYKQIIVKGFLIFSSSFIILSPLLFYFGKVIKESKFTLSHDPEFWSADFLSFFIPSKIQFMGKYFQDITNLFSGNIAENGNYLGYTLIFLALIGLFSRHKKEKWILVTSFFGVIIFFVLALGVHFHFRGIVTQVWLPYKFLYKFVPGFSFTGVPTRFSVLVLFFLAILAAFGLKKITALKIKSKFFKNFLLFLIFLLIGFEFLVFPFPVTKVEKPGIMRDISQEEGDFAIIDLDPNPSKRLYHQTLHQKKMIEGYISRKTVKSENFIENTPVIAELYGKKPITKETPAGEEALEVLRRFDVKYVIIKKGEKMDLVKRYELQKKYQTKEDDIYLVK